MVKELQLDKILYYKKKDKFELFYEKYGSPLFIQLSKGYLAKKIEENTKFIWLGYFSNSIEKNKTFHYLTKIKHCIEKNCNILLETFFYDNGICIPCQNKKGILQLEIYIRQNNTIWEGELIEFPEKSYIIPLIYIENIFLRDNKWRINIKLVQICVFPIYQKFGRCVIDIDNIDNVDNSQSKNVRQNLNTKCIENFGIKEVDENCNYIYMKLSDHPLYSKYFKMCKMGIPKGAVIQKMQTEIKNIDAISILNRHPEDTEKIELVMIEEHITYSRFFKMIKLGVPKAAVEQKMILEGIDIFCLDKGKQFIPNIEIIKPKEIFSEILLKKLKKKEDFEKINIGNKSCINLNQNSKINLDEEPKNNFRINNNINLKNNNLKIGFSMEELLNKRNLLFQLQK